MSAFLARAVVLIFASVPAAANGPWSEEPAPPGLPRPCVAVIVSGSAGAYLEAESGVASALRESEGVSARTISLATREGAESARATLAEGCSLVVVIGTRAAKLALMEARGTPIVYAMVLDPASIGLPAPGGAPQPQVTGVAMDVTPDQQFELMRAVIPGMKRIGIIYDPSVSGDAVRRVRAAARLSGLAVVAQAVRAEADVMGAAALLAPSVDAYWAIADPTVLTQANARALILFSLRARKPMFAISEGYVRNGALAALSAQPHLVGRRAGQMATAVLSGAPIRTLKPELPPQLSLFLNEATAKRLGVQLPVDLLSRASVVYPRR